MSCQTNNFPMYARNVITTAVVVLLLLSLFTGAAAANGNFARIGGENRFETSALIALDRFDSAETVIIARGDQAGQFADGLASSVLAGTLNAPVLLTRPDKLPSSITNAIIKLGARKAIVLGGTGAISRAVVEFLETLNLDVERIEGDNRYETAVKIAEMAADKDKIADYAIIVNGYCPADSLVAASTAFRDQAAILQVAENRIPQVTRNALQSLAIEQVYIVGGSGVVSESVKNELFQMGIMVNRLGGINRYETSVCVAKKLFPGKIDLVVAGGLDENLADSIGASVYARSVLYVKQNHIPSLVKNHLIDTVTADSDIKIIGGTGAVGTEVSAEIKEIINPETDPETEINFVEEIEPNNYKEEANLIDSNCNGSTSYYIFGTITDYYFDVDYYRLDVVKAGRIDIMGIWGGDYLGMGWDDDLAICLMDSDGDILAVAKLYGSYPDYCQYLEYYIPAGTYYIAVFQSSDYEYLYVGEIYALSVHFTPFD